MKKYEREIRELLDKMDVFVPENPGQEKDRSRDKEPEREPRKRSVGVMPQPTPIRPRRSAASRFGQWLTDNHVNTSMRLMLGGLGLVIIAFVILQLLGSPWLWLAQLLGALGGFLFVSPVLLRFFGGKDVDSGPQYWRGQAVENDSFSWRSFRNWLGGRRNRNNKRGNDPWNDRNRNNRW